MAALVGAGMGDKVAVVTDGELSGLNSGITIGQVMPEAAEGGPLAVVQDGDRIAIDMRDLRIDLDIAPKELERRMTTHVVQLSEERPGWLRLYRELVQPLSRGAVLGQRKT